MSITPDGHDQPETPFTDPTAPGNGDEPTPT